MPFFPCVNDLVLRGKTLVIPSISVGNVGQLGVDVILTNVSKRKVGYWYDRDVMYSVCTDPYFSSSTARNTKKMKSLEQKVSVNGSISLSIEVFEVLNSSLIIVQQRAPVLSHARNKRYVENLSNWIKENQFKEVIVLGSREAYVRKDRQIQGSPFYFLVCGAKTYQKQTESLAKGLSWALWSDLEKPVLQTTLLDDLDPETVSEKEYLNTDTLFRSDPSVFLFGGGITKYLYEMSHEKKFNLLALVSFSNEGHNAEDGIDLGKALLRYLHQIIGLKFTEPLQVPLSWNSVFGPPPGPEG